MRLALVGDIGGTNARFALWRNARLEAVRVLATADFATPELAVEYYLASLGLAPGSVGAACLACAGPVKGEQFVFTNNHWRLGRRDFCGALQLDELLLINDFAAMALGMTRVAEAQRRTICNGAAETGAPALVIGPGTGLGVGGLIMRHGRCYPLETEGGHVSFPPGTPEEIRILEILSEQFGRVSNERLICGPGLVNIHRAVCEMAGIDPGQLQPVDVTARALHGDPQAMRTVDVFCAVFGAIAGDLVLTQGAWDGVFLTGGLTPKMLDSLQHSGFRQRFEHKGRFSSIMARVPSLAVMHPHAGLLGAAAYAADAERDAPGVAA